jgi:hypothetical protein
MAGRRPPASPGLGEAIHLPIEETSPMPRDGARPARIPVIRLVRDYQRDWLVRDLLAGLTVWALLVPQALAYALRRPRRRAVPGRG